MTLQIDQSAWTHQNRRNYWQWRVWIEGPKPELDEIDSVTYFLHQTFKNPVRSSRSRRGKFGIKSAGWGEFTIMAHVYKKSGDKEELKHWLRLEDDVHDDEQTANVKSGIGSNKPGSVFLSYAASDAQMADTMMKAFKSAGVHVSTASDLSTDMPWEQAIAQEIEKADFAVAVIPPTENAWINSEVQHALDNNVKVISVMLPDRGNTLQPAFQDLAELRIKDASDISGAAEDMVHSFLSDKPRSKF